MDITRGSRRARHVAAAHGHGQGNNSTNANINTASSPRPVTSEITSSPVPQVAATPSGPSTRLHPSQGASPVVGALVTPDGPPLHRTPDQPPDQRRRRAPPPNPFRLYRTIGLFHSITACVLSYSSKHPISSPNMPSRRDNYTPPPPSHRTNPTHRIKRVPLGELAIKKSSGALIHQRKRVFRPFPSLDQENVEAYSRARHHFSATFDDTMREYVQEMLERNRLYASINTLLAAQQPTDGPRLSMPARDPDGSSSDPEPDESVLLNRARAMATPAGLSSDAPVAYNGTHSAGQDADQELSPSPEEYEDENSIDEDDVDEDEEEGAEHDQADHVAPPFDPATAGLKEISNLARFTVSSHKPGNGVEELKSDDLKQFWQSDGPQPHKLTMYFTKRVGIRDIRFYVDYNEDESYTPTKVVFKAGTSENNLIEFATMALENPVGWQQVPITGAGGDPDGNTLVAWVVQMQILENHQNGKDTHLRGIKIYSFDNDSALGPGRDGNPVDDVLDLMDTATSFTNPNTTRTRLSNIGATHYEPGEGSLSIPDFMREPEIR
ncbi:Anaphase-promoting complex subunit 10 [Fusarium austroafricanum]|uniref:Anaphase-promoting complex subunit 10 n=1 Tax=Fusarium austroafricanum TaxID=2364996 RepID=A0A8H4NTT0_9HYPO|nr:Anaphase-promoting complex subunit 10 [Fusarium austroafricanum]